MVGNQVQFDPGTDFDDLAVGESAMVVVGYDIEDEHGADRLVDRHHHRHRHQ